MKKSFTGLYVLFILLFGGCAVREQGPIRSRRTYVQPKTESKTVIDAPTKQTSHEHVHKHEHKDMEIYTHEKTETAPTEHENHQHSTKTESEPTHEHHEEATSKGDHKKVHTREKQDKALHEMLSTEHRTSEVKEKERRRKTQPERTFVFTLKAPFKTTARGFTPMVLFSLVDEEGNAVSRFGKFLQIADDSPMTVRVYRPGPFYIGYVTSNITSIFRRPIDFSQEPDKSKLAEVAGHPMPGLGPIYFKEDEESVMYSFDVGLHEKGKASNGGVYSYDGVHVVFKGAGIF